MSATIGASGCGMTYGSTVALVRSLQSHPPTMEELLLPRFVADIAEELS